MSSGYYSQKDRAYLSGIELKPSSGPTNRVHTATHGTFGIMSLKPELFKAPLNFHSSLLAWKVLMTH